MFFTTDHPNGAPFTSYPDLFALLMSRDLRAQWLEKLPEEARALTTPGAIKREYMCNDIAVMTRAAPAALLGLRDRGHLRPGARADVALYRPGADRAQTFRAAAYVHKDGDLVVRDGEVARYRFGRAVHVAAPVEAQMRKRMRDYYEDRWPVARSLPRAGDRRGAAPCVRGRAMTELVLNGVAIDGSFAEAFDMRATALIVTADSERCAMHAARRRARSGRRSAACWKSSSTASPPLPSRRRCASG